jgi:hypothetical protein
MQHSAVIYIQGMCATCLHTVTLDSCAICCDSVQCQDHHRAVAKLPLLPGTCVAVLPLEPDVNASVHHACSGLRRKLIACATAAGTTAHYGGQWASTPAAHSMQAGTDSAWAPDPQKHQQHQVGQDRNSNQAAQDCSLPTSSPAGAASPVCILTSLPETPPYRLPPHCALEKCNCPHCLALGSPLAGQAVGAPAYVIPT